ncbi:hypothetical protein Tco_0436470, partial [Tanacetum coccineum]
KRDISYKDSEISVLKSELEKLKQEKESNQLKIEKFDNASKSLDKLIGSQIPDKSKKGVGFVSYNAIPPPHIGLFAPSKLDLSNSGLEEFQQPEFKGYGPKTSKSVMKAYRWVQFDASKQNVDPMIKEPCQAVNEEVKNVNEAADHDNTGFYASLLHKQPSKKVVRISELRSDEVVEGAVVAIPLSAIEEVSARFENTLYGYFIGNRLAFPLMENYVKNTWAKFGLKRIMLDDGIFLF